MALERTFDNVADPQSSDSLIELAEDAAVRFGANAPQTLTARDEAASKLASEGRLGLVKMYEEETLGRRLSMKKSENAREDEATLDNRMRLARYYSERYDTKNAISQLRAVLRTLEAHDHLDWGRIVEARNELICELWMEDQTEVTSEVIEISMKTLDQAVPILGADHERMIHCRYNLAKALAGIGRLEEAVSYFQENIGILEPMGAEERASRQLEEALSDTRDGLEDCLMELSNLHRPENITSEAPPSEALSSGVPSIFPLGTVVSAWTSDTRYSRADVASATEQLCEILCADEVLVPLYNEAIRSDAIGAERFCRNFARLLQICSKELKEESGENSQYLAAKLVGAKASEVAEKVKSRYTMGDTGPKVSRNLHIRTPNARSGVSLDNRPNEHNRPDEVFEENEIEILGPVKEFITDSMAFRNLRASLEAFARPKSSEENLDTSSKYQSPPAFSNLHLVGQKQLSALSDFLATFGFVKKHSSAGTQRIHWRCRCGTDIYDDYEELASGGEASLKYLLQDLASQPMVDSSYLNTASKLGRSILEMARKASTTLVNITQRSEADQTIPLHNDPSIASSCAASTQIPKIDPLFLMLCMKDGKFGTSLYQKDISGLDSDRRLFEFLRDNYARYRGNRASPISLSALEAINFVMLNIITGKTVNISPCGLHGCTCLPPPEKVAPEPDAEYRCEPLTPKRCPPIGSNTLMHLFTHPECYGEAKSTRILDQFAKKLDGELIGPEFGWGLYFKEGWNWEVVKVVILVYMFASLMFGVAWWIGKDDIQGGFGVAGYLVNVATAFLAFIAVRNI